MSTQSITVSGLGRSLVKTWLAQPNSTVVATVQDVEHENAKSLSSFPKGENSKLIVKKLDHANESDPERILSELKSEHRISHIDVILPAAGDAGPFNAIQDIKLEDIVPTLENNTLGPLRLFQTFSPLLNNSSNPRFVCITTGIANLSFIRNFPFPTIPHSYIIAKQVLLITLERLFIGRMSG